MAIYQATKYMDALDLAAAEGFEWDFGEADEDDLFDALEVLGYFWDEDEGCWIGPEANA